MSRYRAKKRLGQNFLKTASVISKIIEAIAPQDKQHIIEIGSGRGALTLPLAESGVPLVAVEFDSDLIGYLTKLMEKYPHVTIVNLDFLTYEPEIENYTLVGNLPYNITSPVIEYACEHIDQIESAYFMTQKEVAVRVCSQPGTKDWSPLAIFSQLYFDINLLFDISPKHFSPPPQVTSSLIELLPKAKREIEQREVFTALVRQAFHQRRKTLLNNLVPAVTGDAEVVRKLLAQSELDEKVRAEQVSTEQFLTLTNLFVKHKLI